MNAITGAAAAATTIASALAPQAKSRANDIKPMDSGTSDPSGTTADGATITSSDFLVLLVTELKNQDPTQPTDPNAYIQQLVGVNSLQQLISINQNLSSSATPTPSSSN